MDQIKDWLASGQVNTSDLAWCDGLPNWIALYYLPGITNNRGEIIAKLAITEDVEQIIELIARARGTGPATADSTQNLLLPRIHPRGQQIKNEVLQIENDLSVSNPEFANALLIIAERFPLDSSSHAILKWWTLLTIVDLGKTDTDTFQKLIDAAESGAQYVVTNAQEAFDRGDGDTGMEYTLWEFCFTSETLRAVSKFKTQEAVAYLTRVFHRQALPARQLVVCEFVLSALGAIGTEDSRRLLNHLCQTTNNQEWRHTAQIIISNFGRYDYDQLRQIVQQVKQARR